MRRATAAVLAALTLGATGLQAGAAGTRIPLPVPSPLRIAAAQAADKAAAQAAPQAEAPSRMAANSSTIPARPPSAVGPVPKPSILLKPGASTPFDGDQRALVEKISAYLSGVRTLVGKFVQVGPDGKRTTGDFYLQKPGRVRFEYDPPSPIDIIADGGSVAVRDRNLATQDIYPLSQTPLRFLLADHLDLMKDTNLISITADDVFVTAVIEERSALVGTNRLMLMFSAKDLQLKQWTVTDPQGYDTTVAVYNLDSTKRPDPSLFKINYERILQ